MNCLPMSLMPLLNVQNGKDAISFYKHAFGVEERFLVEDDEGKIVAAMGIGYLEFWISDESPDHLAPAPRTLGGASARMILVTPEPDALFDRAIAAGAEIVWPVQDQHGWRIGRLIDPFGHHWEVSRPPE